MGGVGAFFLALLLAGISFGASYAFGHRGINLIAVTAFCVALQALWAANWRGR